MIGLVLVALGTSFGALLPVSAQAPSTVTIDAAEPLGPAAAIGELLGVQAGPATVGRRADVDRWVYAAWQDLGLRVNPLPLFGPDGGVKVSRDALAGRW